MTEQEAIKLAIEALESGGTKIGNKPLRACREVRNLSFGKNRTGWVVAVPIDWPVRMDPDCIFVEVYDPDGETHILPLL